MGRPYAEEMDGLPATYEWAMRADVGSLASFVKRASGRPLYAVGSGGSLTAASLAASLHRQAGSPAAAMTPMSLVQGGPIGGGVSILLATSGGNNVDVVDAFNAAVSDPPGRNVCVISAGGDDTGGKAGRLAREHGAVLPQIAAVPSGKDGFLATGSALASCVWLARAYAGMPGSGRGLPAEYGRLGPAVPDTGRINASDRLIILHDTWSEAAAVDAESKLSESGLAAAQVADYRNFAHGRHHGLAVNASRSGIVALVTPQSRDLAMRMLSLLPPSIPVCRLETELGGPAASVSLLVSVMLLVGAVAKARGVDPGRPRVAEFGRRIYSMPRTPRPPKPGA